MSEPGPNTLLLRLEGPLQAWGDTSKFVIRRTMDAPTKSGVIGLICCAMGLSRRAVSACPIERGDLRAMADRLLTDKREEDEPKTVLRLLGKLVMGVRIDRPGVRWWDYHTVGARIGLLKAEGEIKKTASTREIEALVTRREYLCDASFLVTLQGDPELIGHAKGALENPTWQLYLGRKSCPPTVPIFAGVARCDDLMSSLLQQPWRPRHKDDKSPAESGVPCLTEWRSTTESDIAPYDAEVWYDVPVSFDPPAHETRLIERRTVKAELGEPTQFHTPPPERPRADYKSAKFRAMREERMKSDADLCLVCKSPATTVQHVTYRRAGGNETPDDLRSLCRLCHDAVTMLEYGEGMGLDRINPEDPAWRDRILEKRGEIVQFRSLETRRRRLSSEEV